jgi:hypothetical protein
MQYRTSTTVRYAIPWPVRGDRVEVRSTEDGVLPPSTLNSQASMLGLSLNSPRPRLGFTLLLVDMLARRRRQVDDAAEPSLSAPRRKSSPMGGRGRELLWWAMNHPVRFFCVLYSRALRENCSSVPLRSLPDLQRNALVPKRRDGAPE